MARLKVCNPVRQNLQNSNSDLHSYQSTVSEACQEHEVDDDPHVEDRPIFIARMPNLEEPRSLRIVAHYRSIWNRFMQIKSKITDRQQILTLRCIVVLLTCMLFWSMVSKPTPNSPDPTQTANETLLYSSDETYRSQESSFTRPEAPYKRLADKSSARSVREWDTEDISPNLPTTSIDLSETIELSEATPSEWYAVQQSPRRSVRQPQSAWDRDAYSIASMVPVEARNSQPVPSHVIPANVISVNDSSADFSVFAAPHDEAPLNRYNEAQAQYQQNPTMVPNEERYPQYAANTQPGTGVYPPSQTPQSSVSYGQAYPSEANFNTVAQYQYPANHQQAQGMPPGYSNRAVTYQQPNSRSTNASNFREEIPATPTNNTYWNPGTPQAMNPYTPPPQGYMGQNQPATIPQYQQQNYGTMPTIPVNSLNR